MSTVLYRPAASEWRELDSRVEDSGRITVTLYWSEETKQTMVEVQDTISGDRTFEVRAENAAHAFRHPFACSS